MLLGTCCLPGRNVALLLRKSPSFRTGKTLTLELIAQTAPSDADVVADVEESPTRHGHVHVVEEIVEVFSASEQVVRQRDFEAATHDGTALCGAEIDGGHTAIGIDGIQTELIISPSPTASEVGQRIW